MKKQLLAVIAVIICITSALFIDPINSATIATATIQTSGTIIKNNHQAQITVLLRGLTLSQVNPNQNIKQYVENYVGNYTFAANMLVVIGDLHFGGLLQYPNKFNTSYGTWSGTGWTFNQIKTLIDTFHSHGWKVWWGGTAIAWEGQWEQNYIAAQHPELGFTDANGQTANDATNIEAKGNQAGSKTVGYNCLIPDFWANFTSPDLALGIANNTRLIDVLSNNLGKIISAGLTFDGWYPSDGWNGFNVQGYCFPGSDAKNSYSFSLQEENEWAADNTSGFGLPSIGQPVQWNTWTITERAKWILTNSTASQVWHEWWCKRFSLLYLEIKNTIADNNPIKNQAFYSMIAADGSCKWTTGNLGGEGLLNFTMIAEDQSIDRFDVDPESLGGYSSPNYSEIPKDDAYVAGLVKAKDIRLQPLIGIQATSFCDNQAAVPEWNLRQQYLAQVQNYVWFNGLRYQAANIAEFAIQYPPENPAGNVNWWTTSWNNTAVHAFFKYVQDTLNLFYSTPIYLGPTYILPYVQDGWTGNPCIEGINYTIAQWADIVNIKQATTNINSDMGTLFLDQSNLVYSSWFGQAMTKAQEEEILNLFTNKQLNVIVAFGNDQRSSESYISNMFVNGDETRTDNTFGLKYSVGSTSTQTILSNQQINDQYASAIASPYFGVSWSNIAGYYGVYVTASNFFVPIATYNDGRVSIGIGYNETTSRYLYLNNWAGNGYASYAQTAPRQVINAAIYWTSQSPVTSTNSLVDYKIFENANQIIIPMTNHNFAVNLPSNGQPVATTLKIDSQALGLRDVSKYNVYWESDPSTVIAATDWNNIPITLSGMADILVISSI